MAQKIGYIIRDYDDQSQIMDYKTLKNYNIEHLSFSKIKMMAYSTEYKAEEALENINMLSKRYFKTTDPWHTPDEFSVLARAMLTNHPNLEIHKVTLTI